MNYFLSILVFLILIFFINYYIENFNFNSNLCKITYDSDNNLTNVCPTDPKCLALCINEHTWTAENIKNVDYTDTDELPEIGKIKKNINRYFTNNCDKCIDNFSSSVDLIYKSGTKCDLE